MLRSDSEPLGPFVQMDEALVGGKGGPHNQLVLVAAEANGRVRLAHAGNNDAGTLEIFATAEIAADAHVATDGHAGYRARSLGPRPHETIVQTKAERREADALQPRHQNRNRRNRCRSRARSPRPRGRPDEADQDRMPRSRCCLGSVPRLARPLLAAAHFCRTIADDHPQPLRGEIKRPDFLVGVPTIGTTAVDVKAKRVYADAIIIDAYEHHALLNFETFFNISVWFACFPPDEPHTCHLFLNRPQ